MGEWFCGPHPCSLLYIFKCIWVDDRDQDTVQLSGREWCGKAWHFECMHMRLHAATSGLGRTKKDGERGLGGGALIYCTRRYCGMRGQVLYCMYVCEFELAGVD